MVKSPSALQINTQTGFWGPENPADDTALNIRPRKVLVLHYVIEVALFQKLVAAHVACLCVATPLEQKHIINFAVVNCHHVVAK